MSWDDGDYHNLNAVAREGHSTFRLRSEGVRGGSHVKTGKSDPGGWTSKCKGPEVDTTSTQSGKEAKTAGAKWARSS